MSAPFPRPATGRPMSAAERLRLAHLAAGHPVPPNLAPPKLDPLRRRVHTVEEVAGIMRVSKMTVYRLFHEGAFPGAHRVGKTSIRIPESGVRAYLKSVEDEAS